MKGFTIISYPTQKNDNLLSLTQGRSRYMLPLGGRFRVADFTIRNSVSSGADGTIIYSNEENDGLKEYLEEYREKQEIPGIEENEENSEQTLEPLEIEEEGHVIQTFPLTKLNLDSALELIRDSKSSKFIIYNGDNPSIIDFKKLVDKFIKSKKQSILFKLKINGKASMAHKILICHKRTLLSVIKKAIKQGYEVPNFFEMIINLLIHNRISTASMEAWYWPLKSIHEYRQLNREIIWNGEIAELLQKEGELKSQIKSDQFALIDRKGSATKSFISDYCYINGKVENSIIFPGAEIHANAHVKNSIILPFVTIGPKARVINSIIDENTEPESEEYTIGESCQIGSEEAHIKNSTFPKLLNESLTLIGRGNQIPHGSKIGAGCYIAGDLTKSPHDKIILREGESLL